MKLIGITGKAGSGKTTFSDILAQKDNIGVIHVDDILKTIKLKYFKIIMENDKRGQKTKVNSRLKTILYKNKILFKLLMMVRVKLVKKTLDKQINELEKIGKKFVLIDDTFLQYEKCYKELSSIILLERPFVERRKSLMERDAISKEEVVAYDVAIVSGNYKEDIKDKRIIRVVNNRSKKELAAEADRIYNDNFQTIRERYRYETKDEEVIQPANQRKIISREEEIK